VEVADLGAREGETVRVCIRPEALQVLAAGQAAPAGMAKLQATIVGVEFIGALSRLDVELPGGSVLKVAVLDNPATLARSGDSIALVYDPARVIVFPQGAS
jgi:ABC-type Fe3+/spermidine/putrescine transport system ATPase subunit